MIRIWEDSWINFKNNLKLSIYSSHMTKYPYPNFMINSKF